MKYIKTENNNIYENTIILQWSVREAAKKVLLSMAVPSKWGEEVKAGH